MNERIFDIEHRLVATEKLKLQIPFEEVMLFFWQASKELHWSLAKEDVMKGEFTFATPKTYRCAGEVIFIKVQIDKQDEDLGEICDVKMMSRPRRSFTLFDLKKNLYNIQQLTELLSDYIYLEDEVEDLDN